MNGSVNVSRHAGDGDGAGPRSRWAVPRCWRRDRDAALTFNVGANGRGAGHRAGNDGGGGILFDIQHFVISIAATASGNVEPGHRLQQGQRASWPVGMSVQGKRHRRRARPWPASRSMRRTSRSVPTPRRLLPLLDPVLLRDFGVPRSLGRPLSWASPPISRVKPSMSRTTRVGRGRGRDIGVGHFELTIYVLPEGGDTGVSAPVRVHDRAAS